MNELLAKHPRPWTLKVNDELDGFGRFWLEIRDAKDRSVWALSLEDEGENQRIDSIAVFQFMVDCTNAAVLYPPAVPPRCMAKEMTTGNELAPKHMGYTEPTDLEILKNCAVMSATDANYIGERISLVGIHEVPGCVERHCSICRERFYLQIILRLAAQVQRPKQ